jgi:hypothetical protein
MKFGAWWMKFDEVSSRIMEKWGALLRKFWSVGGDGLS